MATRKSAVSVDEKFTNQDLDLFTALAQIDAKNYNWFSELTDEQKKKFVPYMMVHWMSSVKKSGPVGAYYVMSVDHCANKYMFNESVQDHPELQWLMLCASSPGIGKQLHTWLPHLKDKVTKLKERAQKKDVKDYFSKIIKQETESTIQAETFTKSQHHCYNLAKLYPNMKLDDIKLLSELVTEEDIKQYEKDSGN